MEGYDFSYLRADLVGKVSKGMSTAKSAEFSIVVVRSQSVVSASLDIDSAQIRSEFSSHTEQEVGDLKIKTLLFNVHPISSFKR